MIAPFSPPPHLRHPMLQTILASRGFRVRGPHAIDFATVDDIITTLQGVKLLGKYSVHPNAKALFIFLHGWEGCHGSSYIKSATRFVFDKNCSVYRLNFRDHGFTHHLNPDLFHSARLEEVYDAIQYILDAYAANLPVYLVGFSLGGNFALRVVLQREAEDKHADFQHVLAVSPVLDPLGASPLVDKNPLIKRYFLKKWRRSLKLKEAAFPNIYNFADLDDFKDVTSLSQAYIPDMTGFSTVEDYFKSYEINPSDLAKTSTPLTVITSKDDPVIPVEPALNIPPGGHCHTLITEYGGHNGFFESLLGETYYETYLGHLLKA